jgi:hypothetical protein
MNENNLLRAILSQRDNERQAEALKMLRKIKTSDFFDITEEEENEKADKFFGYGNYNLYTVTKEKTKILGLWKDNESGKIFRDNIVIKNLSGENLYKEKKALFSSGEKAVFYILENLKIAIIENENGQKEVLQNCITWTRKNLRPSLVKFLLHEYNGVTIFKNQNGYILEIWK